ncbi:MAG: FAD-binding oxidoreductase [Clostridiales Family XIII bacterium]|nr:FAD-binding oxidoreductase [Clostridiales Family XIII bacterium]
MQINIKEITEEYLSDESALPGYADGICFPENTDEVSRFLRYAHEIGSPVTIQGSRTGIRAGAVPHGGLVCNLSKLNRIDKATKAARDNSNDSLLITVGAGATLSELSEALDVAGWFFPPNPTEDTATVGAVVATGSMGGRLQGYGCAANYVEAVTLAEKDGAIRRIDWQCRPASFTRGQVELPFGEYGDAGSVVTELTLRVVRKPQFAFMLFALFTGDASACDFAESAVRMAECLPEVKLAQLEYIDAEAIRAVSDMKNAVSEFQQIPEIDSAGCACGILLELTGDEEDALLAALEEIPAMLDAAGAPADRTIVAETASERTRLDTLRHAVIKAGNMKRTESLRAHGFLSPICDIVVPRDALRETLAKIKNESPCARYTYGHIGAGHIHMHFTARTQEESDKAERFARELYAHATNLGGGAASEFGGKRRK